MPTHALFRFQIIRELHEQGMSRTGYRQRVDVFQCLARPPCV
jgi:hypothetical protein